MRRPKPVVLDCETFGIDARPHYPPIPCGVSVQWPGRRPHYYGFGHLEQNNCTWDEARDAIRAAYAHPDGVVFQNGKFDADVIETHFALPIPEWRAVHDTMFLLFLYDPNQLELGLKSSASRLLGLLPEERDDVVEWLLTHQPVPGVCISKSKSSAFYAMKYLPFAPGNLVGAYANGDTDRTGKLFNFLWPDIIARKMGDAYDRERQLMPILLEMERRGVMVDLTRLSHDCSTYTVWAQRVTTWICAQMMKTPETLNLDSGDQLMKALIGAHKIEATAIPKTKTGKHQSNKEALLAVLHDKALLAMLKYRTQLNTCVRTFMEPWQTTAVASGGFIFTTWNQIKSPSSDGGTVGARTGRLSSTPNFQNIPNVFVPIFAHETTDATQAKTLPVCPIDGLPSLPHVRSYITPFPGHVLIDRDYCFGPETEVLTKEGFVLFDKLPRTVEVAQWENGVVTYAVPTDYQVQRFTGTLIHITGTRSTDLLVTPNHQCLLMKGQTLLKVRADTYPIGHYRQIHAGIYIGQFTLPTYGAEFLVAVQADSTVKSNSLAWKLTQTRKTHRLHTMLTALTIPYTVTSPPSTPGYRITYVKYEHLPTWVHACLDIAHDKTFTRQLTELAAPQRLVFLQELAWWNGRRNCAKDAPKNWSYRTTNMANANLVQEVACLTGLRAHSSTIILPSGKKFARVNMRSTPLTWTQTYTVTLVPYTGPTYCVTMPQGTVIVRRHGHVMVTSNSQQELRILAHFDGGALMKKYLENPWLDFHDYARDELAKMGLVYARKPVKNTNLGLIYGMGVGKLALKNGMTVDEASRLKKSILLLYPGLKEMYADMKARAREIRPVRTWGGREYYCEKPTLVDGRIREYDYKLVNVLIQGSAADCTKEAIIRFDAFIRAHHHRQWKMLFNVHDQVTVSVPIADVGTAMNALQDAMESIEFDVTMLTEGSTSHTHWNALIAYDKKGVVCLPKR